MFIIFIIAAIFLADRLSKQYVSENIREGSYREIVKNKLYVTNMRNTGAAYGLLAKKPKTLLLCTAVSVLWAVFSLFQAVKNKGTLLEKLSLACILGGAAGNVSDRLRLKYVTDFIYIKPAKWKNAPIFNVADIFIFIGSLLYIVSGVSKK